MNCTQVQVYHDEQNVCQQTIGKSGVLGLLWFVFIQNSTSDCVSTCAADPFVPKEGVTVITGQGRAGSGDGATNYEVGKVLTKLQTRDVVNNVRSGDDGGSYIFCPVNRM